MSTNTSNDTQANGVVLPEGIQPWLKQLHEYVMSLVKLTRPGQADESTEGHAPMHSGAMAIGLDQLAQQIAQVMAALSPPGERGSDAAASAADAGADVRAGEGDDIAETNAALEDIIDPATGKRYVSGVTLEQIDDMNLLLASLRALGNVVVCSDHAELSSDTLTVMGDAIYRDVRSLRKIVDAIYESQALGTRYELHSVCEAHASYLALPIDSPTPRTLALMQEHPTYQ